MENIISQKRCTKCHFEHPLTDFIKKKESSDGLSSWCKHCYRQRAKERYEKKKSQLNCVTTIIVSQKICTKCKEMKPSDAFSRSATSKDGLFYYCKDCVKRSRDPRQSKNHSLKHLYGITLDRYNQMLQEQQGTCAICHQPPKTGKWLDVDHDHETGLVRGLLCNRCNQKLGKIEGRKCDLKYLEFAIQSLPYLHKHRRPGVWESL